MNKRIKTKYFNFIQDCYHHQTFDKMLLRDVHKVGFTLLRAMVNTDTISTKGGVTTWIGPQLSQSLVQEIYNEYNHLKRLETKKLRAKRAAQQLEIKPLKRVASLIEPPVQPSDMHNDGQLTWMHLALIFCAGILAGGLIATIWK